MLTVPNRAIKHGKQAEAVTVLFEGQQIQTRRCRPGSAATALTEITSGLKEGDVVVLNDDDHQATSSGGSGHPGRVGAITGMETRIGPALLAGGPAPRWKLSRERRCSQLSEDEAIR